MSPPRASWQLRAYTRQLRQIVGEALDTTAVSLTGCVALIPGMVITDAAFTTPYTTAPLLRVLASFFAWSSMTALLLVAGRLVLPRLSAGTPRRLVVVTTYALSGGVRVGSLLLMIPDAQLTAAAAGVRVVSTVVWLSAVAVLVTGLRRSTRQAARLQSERIRLDNTRRQAGLELLDTVERLNAVRALITKAIDEVKAALQPDLTREELRAVADRLAWTVEELVRPTSHDLVSEAPYAREPAGPPVDRAVPWWQTVAGIAAAWPKAAPFQPLSVLVLTVPISAGAVLSGGWDPVGVLLKSAAFMVQIGLLWLLGALATPAIPRLPRLGQMALVLTGYVVLLVSGLAGNAHITNLGSQSQAETALLVFTAAVASGGGAALDARLQAAEQATEHARDQSSWQVSRTRQQLWAESRRLAITLHGQVQAALTACEFLIRRWLETAEAAPVAPLIERLHEALARAAGLQSPEIPATVRAGLEEVALTWRGILPVTLATDVEAERALDNDQDGRDAVIEVTRELLLNAVRHGRAHEVRVDAQLGAPQVVALTVTERGVPGGPTDTPAPEGAGFGFKLLDSVSLGWVTRTSANTRVTEVHLATAPLDPPEKLQPSVPAGSVTSATRARRAAITASASAVAATPCAPAPIEMTRPGMVASAITGSARAAPKGVMLPRS